MKTQVYFYKFETRGNTFKAWGVRFEVLELPTEQAANVTFPLLCSQHLELKPWDLKAFKFAVARNV